MTESVAWLIPWTLVAIYVIWAVFYDRSQQGTEARAEQ